MPLTDTDRENMVLEAQALQAKGAVTPAETQRLMEMAALLLADVAENLAVVVQQLRKDGVPDAVDYSRRD